jgi:hypothetical protein
MVRRGEPRGTQTWKTFIKNHAAQIFAVDFLTQTTAFFAVVYIFVVMEIASRRIVLINVTTNPGLGWVQQQLRRASVAATGSRKSSTLPAGRHGRPGSRPTGTSGARTAAPSQPRRLLAKP